MEREGKGEAVTYTPCCVVAGNSCKAPANFDMEGERGARAECFACGDKVCTSPDCSLILAYLNFGRRRICTTCQETHGVGDRTEKEKP